MAGTTISTQQEEGKYTTVEKKRGRSRGNTKKNTKGGGGIGEASMAPITDMIIPDSQPTTKKNNHMAERAESNN